MSVCAALRSSLPARAQLFCVTLLLSLCKLNTPFQITCSVPPTESNSTSTLSYSSCPRFELAKIHSCWPRMTLYEDRQLLWESLQNNQVLCFTQRVRCPCNKSQIWWLCLFDAEEKAQGKCRLSSQIRFWSKTKEKREKKRGCNSIWVGVPSVWQNQTIGQSVLIKPIWNKLPMVNFQT